MSNWLQDIMLRRVCENFCLQRKDICSWMLPLAKSLLDKYSQTKSGMNVVKLHSHLGL